MRYPLILYPVVLPNIAGNESCFWVQIEVNTGKIFYNFYMPTKRYIHSESDINNLLFFSRLIPKHHRILSNLLRQNNGKIPHEIIDLEIEEELSTDFILPSHMSEFEAQITDHLKGTDTVSFRDEVYFDDYINDLTTFAETVVYSEFLDHTQVGDHAISKEEQYYGRYQESYSKVYEIKSKEHCELSYDHEVVQRLLRYSETFLSMRSHDVVIVSIQISSEVPLFLRDHNSLQEMLTELGLYSVDYLYKS